MVVGSGSPPNRVAVSEAAEVEGAPGALADPGEAGAELVGRGRVELGGACRG